jgi:multidrug resistance efflux pump
MQELESQLAGINSEITGLQGKLKAAVRRINPDYQKAVNEGAIARKVYEDEQDKQDDIKRQIEEKKHQAEAKKFQIDGVRDRLEQDFKLQQFEEAQFVEVVNSAKQEVKKAIASIHIREKLANQREKELQRVQNRQKDLIIRSSKAGNVINPDLDKKQKQFIQAGSLLFEIVNPKQQIVEANVKQEDRLLVKKGQSVTFRPQGMGLLSYKGTVVSIDPVVSPLKDAQQPRTVKVYVSLNKEENLALLQPGVSGVAHIEVESMFLYQKLQRELEKLIPLEKFF